MVFGGHNTDIWSSLTYSSVVSHDYVRIDFTTESLNDLKGIGYDIQNAYPTNQPCEKVGNTAVSEFVSRIFKTVLIARVLYGLKLSGAAFRAFITETSDTIGYRLSYDDPYVWMRP